MSQHKSRWNAKISGTRWTATCKVCRRTTYVKEDLARCPRGCEAVWEREQRKAKAKKNRPQAETSSLFDISKEVRARDN